MIAADGTVSELEPVIMSRAETNGNPRQSRHGLDHSDELRRAKHAAELPKASGKNGKPAPSPSFLGGNTAHYRGRAGGISFGRTPSFGALTLQSPPLPP